MEYHDEELEVENHVLNGSLHDVFAVAESTRDTSNPVHANHPENAENNLELTSLAPPQDLSAKPPMRNPSRERRKRELGFLREYVVELETELVTLRARKRSTLSIAWKNIADDERVKRQRVEQENARLRLSLETQLRVAEHLSSYLRDAEPLTLYTSPTHIPPRFMASAFDLVVAQLQRDIERAYLATDTIFTGPSWTTLPDERVFVTTVKTRPYGGGDQLYIELMDTAYRAHPYERTCEAAWEATRVVYASGSRVIDAGLSTEDFLAVQYRTIGQTRRGLPKDLLVTVVAKKFMEQDRMVLIWRTSNRSAEPDQDMPMQAVSDETGWMMLTKVPEGIPNRPAGTAFFQACSRLVPAWVEDEVVDTSVRTQLAIGEFTNVVLSATEADVSGFESAFQRLVLEDDKGRVEPIGDQCSVKEAEVLTAYV